MNRDAPRLDVASQDLDRFLRTVERQRVCVPVGEVVAPDSSVSIARFWLSAL